MPSPGILRREDLVRTDVSEERIVSIVRTERIAELGTTLTVINNRITLRSNTTNVVRSSPILATLMM
jgi:hypothetical protein